MPCRMLRSFSSSERLLAFRLTRCDIWIQFLPPSEVRTMVPCAPTAQPKRALRKKTSVSSASDFQDLGSGSRGKSESQKAKEVTKQRVNSPAAHRVIIGLINPCIYLPWFQFGKSRRSVAGSKMQDYRRPLGHSFERGTLCSNPRSSKRVLAIR